MEYLNKIIAITAMAGLILLGIFLYESGCQASDSDSLEQSFRITR
jgi:hypothetical protein